MNGVLDGIINNVDNDTGDSDGDSGGTKIISLSGYAQSGKDTVAQVLVEQLGYTRIAFADGVREAVLLLDPYIPLPNGRTPLRLSKLVDLLGWDKAKTEFEEVRRLLQVMGTEVGRELIDPDIWVNIAFDKIGEGKYVFTDTRFPNEFEALSDDLDAITVWISRPGVGPVNNHPSETALDDEEFDVVLNNDGTLADLKAKALWLDN